jgi:hypothetical protein
MISLILGPRPLRIVRQSSLDHRARQQRVHHLRWREPAQIVRAVVAMSAFQRRCM